MEAVALVSRADLLERLRECEGQVAAARADQVRVLRDLSRRGQLPNADELASVLDVSLRTARDLLETAWRTPEESRQMAHLEAGTWSFDRATATSYLFRSGADPDTMAAAAERDIAGVYRLRSLQERITRRSEREAYEQRSLRVWASLDAAMGYIHAELAGYDWQLVTQAVENRAEHLPHDETATAQQRRADGLVALARDWLSGDAPDHRRTGPVVTVTVDAAIAAETQGEAGVAITAGPRIGPETLDRVLCEGSVEVIVDSDSGVPLAVGPTSRVIPPKLRRWIIARDQRCVIDGCDSGYRLEVHHIVPRSQGGTHHPDNLTTLCWWHHHHAIHGQGRRFDSTSPPRRRRLLPPVDP